MPFGKQENWLKFTSTDESQTARKNLQEDPVIGLKQMKNTFDQLYYIHIGKPTTHYDGRLICNGFHHPADTTMDYNCAVDMLEDEHLKRKICTVKKAEMVESEEEFGPLYSRRKRPLNFPLPKRKRQ